MPLLRGEKILVTGPNGQVGFPIARELAKANEVYGLARLSKAEDRARLEGAGLRCLSVDLGQGDLSAVPDDFTYVFHFAVVMDPKASWEYAMEVNAQATGRLLHHCRRAKGFLHCSSAAVYHDKGHEPIHEEDPLGDGMGSMVPTYSISKIAAEQVVRLGSSLWGVPATIARLGLP